MHHLLCLSGKQMEAVVIGVAQRERTRLDERASWEIPSFFFFTRPCMQKHLLIPTPIAPPLCLLFSILSQLETKRSITAFAEQHQLGGIARINHKCVHGCRRQLHRPEPENNSSRTVLFEASAARVGAGWRGCVEQRSRENILQPKPP